MAAELGKFLSEQLAKLPSDHPDRVFLEGIEKTTAAFTKRPSSYKTQAREAATQVDLARLGQVLKEKRKEWGIPQAEVARRANVDRNTLWALERSKNPKTGKPSRPSKDKLERLGRVLRFNPEEQKEIMTLAGYDP